MRQAFLILSIFALTASACSTAPNSSPSLAVTPARPTVQVTPVASATPTSALPSKDLIKIAVAAPLSGEQATLGEGIRGGTQLAIKQLSKPLSDLGFQVQLASFDDQARTDLGAARAKDIIADPDVLVVIGNLNSDPAIAASDIYKSAGLAMISPASTNPKLTSRGYANVNRLSGRDDMQGPAAAHFIGEQLKLNKAYILHDKTSYGQGTAQAFSDEARKIGMIVVGLEGSDEGSNFDSSIAAMKNSGADAVFFTGGYLPGANLLRQMRDKGVRSAFVATERIDNPEFPRLAGQAAEGIYLQSAGVAASAYPDAAQFIRDYKAEYKQDAPPYAAQAYDATAIAIRALTGLAKDGKATRQAVAQAIRATQGFIGVTGITSFNSSGDPTKSKYFFLKVTTADPRRWEENPIIGFVELAPPTQ